MAEFFQPTLSWNPRVLGGNRFGLLRSCRRGGIAAVQHFGRPDLIHAHVAYPAGWIAMHLSREFGAPYVLTEHMGPFPLAEYTNHAGQAMPYVIEPLRRAAARIAVSASLARDMASHGVEDVHVVPNFVDERVFAATPPAAAPPVVFLTVASLHPIKGVDVTLRAIARLREMLPDAFAREAIAFRIIGDGPERDPLLALARQLDLGRHLAWLGAQPHAVCQSELQRAHVHIMSSHRETFSIATIEAMASGRPVIATRCGGPESIVTPATGVLVPPEDPEALAQAMASMIEDRSRFDWRAVARSCLDRFSRRSVVDQLDAIFQDVLPRG